MSIIAKWNMYTVQCATIVECSRAIRYRKSTDHFIIGGMCVVITELLFAKYFIDDVSDSNNIYSDSRIVASRIPDEYVAAAQSVIYFRNKFAHEFGTEEYYETFESVMANMDDIVRMCYHMGALCKKEERDFLTEYYQLEKENFYDAMLKVFREVGPIGYANLVQKIKRKLSKEERK